MESREKPSAYERGFVEVKMNRFQKKLYYRSSFGPINLLTLEFPETKQENTFKDWYYGETISPIYSAFYFIGAFLYFTFIFTDLTTTSRLLWVLTDILFVGYFLVGGVLFLLPSFVSRKFFVELFFGWSYLALLTKAGVRDIDVSILLNLEHQYVIHYGVFFVMFIVSVAIKPRVKVLWYFQIINATLYVVYVTLFAIFFDFENKYQVIISIISVVFHHGVVFLMVYYIEIKAREYFVKIYRLNAEKEKIEIENLQNKKLLKNILPEYFIDDIQTKEFLRRKLVVKNFPKCILFFSDIENFTVFCSKVSSKEVIKMLQVQYSTFDTLMSEFKGLEKVKTIGDAYMCILNSNEKRIENDLKKMLLFSIYSIVFFQKNNVKNGWKSINLRIGVNFDPDKIVKGCVFGTYETAITFEVYGDRIEEVMELEESSIRNGINVNEKVFLMMKEYFLFKGIKESFMIDVGKGVVDWVVKDKMLLKRYGKIRKKFDSSQETRVIHNKKLIQKNTNYEKETKINFKKIQKEKFIQKMKKIRCVSANGLIYPLLLYNSPKKEYTFQINSNRKYLRVVNAFLALISMTVVVILLLFFVIMKNDWEDFYLNPIFWGFYVIFIFDFFAILFFLVFPKKISQNLVVSIVFNSINSVIFTITACVCLISRDYFSKFGISIFQYLVDFSALFVIWIDGIPIIFRAVLLIFLYIPMIIRTILYFEFLGTNDVTIFFAIIVSGLVGTVQRENFTRLSYEKQNKINVKKEQLKTEKRKNEILILSVLPLFVLKKLREQKVEKDFIYNDIRESCVCFVKIDGCQSCEIKLIKFLSDLFIEFDEYLMKKKNSIVKIKTFQFNYLFFSEKVDTLEYLENIIESSLVFLEIFKKRSEDEWKDEQKRGEFSIKIGIHNGGLSAGVVGISKYLFDVFGDTVNISSRLCDSSQPNKVQIMDKTLKVNIGILDKFLIVKRGMVDLKGKGKYKTSYVISKKGKKYGQNEEIFLYNEEIM